MEKAPPLTSDLVTLAAFALQASQSLYQTIESFRSEKRNVFESWYGFQSLSRILEAFRQVAAENQAGFVALKLPLLQCGKICTKFAEAISKCMTHSNGEKTKFWEGVIATWRTTLAAYKVVMSIALGDATFREAAVATGVLDDYKRLIAEAMSGLQKHSEPMYGRPQSLLEFEFSNGRDIDKTSIIREEDESLKQCVTICGNVFKSVDNSRAQKYSAGENQLSSPGLRDVGSAVTVTNEMLVEFQDRLSEYSTILDSLPIGLNEKPQGLSWQGAEHMKLDNAELNDTREGSDKDTPDPAETARKNIFEDIASADNSHQLIVSTIGDPLLARRIFTGTMSLQWLGQMSDDTLQKLSKDRNSRVDEKEAQAQTGQDKFDQYGVGRDLRGVKLEGGRGPY